MAWLEGPPAPPAPPALHALPCEGTLAKGGPAIARGTGTGSNPVASPHNGTAASRRGANPVSSAAIGASPTLAAQPPPGGRYEGAGPSTSQ